MLTLEGISIHFIEQHYPHNTSQTVTLNNASDYQTIKLTD